MAPPWPHASSSRSKAIVNVELLVRISKEVIEGSNGISFFNTSLILLHLFLKEDLSWLKSILQPFELKGFLLLLFTLNFGLLLSSVVL